MTNQVNTQNIKEQILEKLEPMGDVSLVGNFLFKDEIKFGMVKNETVHLIEKDRDFKEVDKDVLHETDRFLEAATKAYWIASGKI